MNLHDLYTKTLLENGKVENAIEKAIEDRGYDSQADAAKAAGVACSSFSRYKHLGSQGNKSRKRKPSLDTLLGIKDALGDQAYQAILSGAKTDLSKHKTIRQRAKLHHGTRHTSINAMRKAQKESGKTNKDE